MAPIVAWKRFVRYIPVNTIDVIHYGDPILSNGSGDVGELAAKGSLEVEMLEGADPLSARPTGRREKVGKLLGPLEPKDVPIVRCIGLNYKTHILETGRPLPTCPTVFVKPSPTVADHGEKVPIPRLAQEQCDYEGELTIVIGVAGKDIPAESALSHVAAYTCGNDVSARDWQRQPGKAGPVPQWGFSKSFDKYAPLGPCLVSSEILGAADTLNLKTIVNGEVRQSGNTSDLCFGVKELVAFCSQGQTLEKGSLIMTGTPGGVGLFMKPEPKFLKHGDTVEVRLSGIGTLMNEMDFQ